MANRKARRTVLAVAAAVAVAVAASLMLKDEDSPPTENEKTIRWELLEAENGTSLFRLETPKGWIVEGEDGYLVTVEDPNKEWLAEEE